VFAKVRRIDLEEQYGCTRDGYQPTVEDEEQITTTVNILFATRRFVTDERWWKREKNPQSV
jgi:hypothetical protein